MLVVGIQCNKCGLTMSSPVPNGTCDLEGVRKVFEGLGWGSYLNSLQTDTIDLCPDCWNKPCTDQES